MLKLDATSITTQSPDAPERIPFQGLTQGDLADLLIPLSVIRQSRSGPEVSADELQAKKVKQARYRAQQIFHWVYQRGVTSWQEMSDLSKNLRTWLEAQIEIVSLTEKIAKDSEDGTKKVLWTLRDGKTIESVLIPAALTDPDGDPLQDASRLTLCISSQVGCAMACKFCLTGVQGLDRHLGTHEIVAQVQMLRQQYPITNIVFMGMGEPLHNVDAVAKACRILIDQDGLGFSKRKVTVSTSGLVPGIEKLGKQVDVSLAISLNASYDEQRSQIMPVNLKWNLQALLKACREFPLGGHRKITFEYVLLRDFNDSLEDAARVEKLLKGIPSKINIIPFNEHSGSEFKRPDDSTVKAFQHYFVSRGWTATVRLSRGRDILAACGQLRSVFGTARGTEKHRDFQQTGRAAQV